LKTTFCKILLFKGMPHRQTIRNAVTSLVILFTLILAPHPALAWNRAGHMVSGAIAYSELKQRDPKALSHVIAILHKHPDYKTRWASHTEQANISRQDRNLFLFMLAARWPDDVRSIPDEKQFNHPKWHYVDIPYTPDPTASISLPQPDPENALTAIESNLAVLRSHDSNEDKAIALCWLFHLIGDIHQPMHTISLFSADYPEGDKGGNLIFIRVKPDSSTINLHAFWDDLILGSERFQTVRNRAVELRLQRDLQRSELPELSNSQIESWAKQESHSIAIQQAYRNGQFIGSQDKTNGAVLPSDYVATVKPIAERRLVLAGYRLADLLEQSF